jgi:protein-S-isoprenylcysteine O-methyltransferase Ste14
VYQVLIGSALIIAIGSFWSNAPLLGKFDEQPAWLCTAGLLVSIAGAALFELAIRALGSQYSPCFDLRIPAFRVMRGPYRWLPHPIYTGNLMILLGVFIACGSLWVLLVGCIVGVFYFRSARTERRLLKSVST